MSRKVLWRLWQPFDADPDHKVLGFTDVQDGNRPFLARDLSATGAAAGAFLARAVAQAAELDHRDRLGMAAGASRSAVAAFQLCHFTCPTTLGRRIKTMNSMFFITSTKPLQLFRFLPMYTDGAGYMASQ